MSWNTDMSQAPKTFREVIWLYFPFEGLDLKSWDRVIACHWNQSTKLWTWKDRAYRSYSREYQPTHWQPYTEEKPEPPDDI